MCRWITVLSSEDLSLSDVVLAPQNSLLQLSRDASFNPRYSTVNNHTTNGDGFGVGWYHSNTVNVPRLPLYTRRDIKGHENMYAATFRDTAPAWNNQNLREICVATRSHCILAHVRAASPFAAVTQENCHPFKAGRLLFCHNGRIGNFRKIRRALLARLTNEAFGRIRGTTDSEAIFALVLTFLQEDGKKQTTTPFQQKTPFGPLRMVYAIKKTLKYVVKLLKEAGATDNFSTMNFALTDGESLVVTRFCDKSPSVLPPSLYFAYGNVQALTGEMTSKDPAAFLNSKSDSEPPSNDEDGSPQTVESADEDGETTYDELPITLQMRESLPGLLYRDVDPSKAMFVVASNPLTKTHTWNPMPRNSIMWCTRGQMPELRLLRDKKPKTKILSDHTFVMENVKIGPVVIPDFHRKAKLLSDGVIVMETVRIAPEVKPVKEKLAPDHSIGEEAVIDDLPEPVVAPEPTATIAVGGPE